jgi:hypothetical protein
MGMVKEFLTKSVEFVREEIMPVRGELMKAGILTPKGGYEPKSSLIDPFNYNATVHGYKEKYSLMDYWKARQVSYADPVISAIVQTRANQVAAFAVPQEDRYRTGFKISLRDKKKKMNGADKKRADEIAKFMMNCGYEEKFEDTPLTRRRDSFETFLRKIARDSLTFDQVNFEIVPRKNDIPHQFMAVDAATIRLLPDQRDMVSTFGGLPNAKENAGTSLIVRPYNETENVKPTKVPMYVQIINSTPRATFNEWEMAFGVRNPRTDILSNGYGFSEIEMLLTTITAHLNADTYNRRFFSQGSAQKGILAFEGNVPPDQLEAFRRQYHQQVSGVQNAWKTPIIATGKDTKMNWQSMHSTNREMEWGKYIEYLVKTICGVYQIDPIEIGFDISKNSSGQGGDSSLGGQGQQVERLKWSKDRGLDPLLRFIANLINDYIVFRINPEFEFEFVGLNTNSEKEQVDLDKAKVETFETLDELRAEHDLPAMKKPEDIKSVGDMVLNPQFIQAFQSMSMAGQDPMGGEMMGGPEGGGGEGDLPQPGPDEEPDYDNMTTEELEAELAKLEGKGGDETGKSMEAKRRSLELIL